SSGDLRRRPLAAVPISWTRSSGSRLNCRYGIGWRTFVTSTIAHACAQKSLRLRSAPLLLQRPNLPNLPVSCRGCAVFRPLLRLPTTRIGRLSANRHSGTQFSEGYPPPRRFDCRKSNTEELAIGDLEQRS